VQSDANAWKASIVLLVPRPTVKNKSKHAKLGCRAPFLIGFLAVAPACSDSTQNPGPPVGGAAGNGGTGTSGGAAGTGGLPTSGAGGSGGVAGGVAGSGGGGATQDGGGGRAGTAGSGGSAGAADGGGRDGAAGSNTGGSGGSSGSAGSGGSAGRSGGAGSGGAAGSIDAGGSVDAGSDVGTGTDAGPDTDRCGVANLDPANPPRATTLSGNLGTHDPVVIFAHGQYYLFQTGGGQGLGAKTSANLLAWSAAPAVLSPNPAWVATQVSGATNLWAPDISFFGGVYHLYYSASTFGSNHSCIGHATRAALNAGNWADQGSVVCSNASGSSDNWNAIDPNVIVDTAGTPWLSFGSFWGGLKMIELDAAGGRANQTLHSIAARPSNGGALEAPFIVRRCGYYYLFVSFDRCCDGANSTYKIMVGRSTSVTGPYADKAGTPMMQGGGTLLVEGLPSGQTGWHGPGHNAVIFTDTAAYNVYHAYADNGGSSLRISSIAWDTAGWPVSGGP
jgi:arabinan endo-1,5-alpha-L-arabinosidase